MPLLAMLRNAANAVRSGVSSGASAVRAGAGSAGQGVLHGIGAYKPREGVQGAMSGIGHLVGSGVKDLISSRIDLQRAKDLALYQHQLAGSVPHNHLGALATNMAAMAGAAGIIGGAGMVMDHMKVQQGYKKMLDAYPELAREQPERVKSYFDAIASGAPDIASQPLVAGSLIKRMLNYDGFDPSTYQELVSTQTNIDRVRNERIKNVITAGNSGLGQMHTYGIGADPNRRR